MGPARWACSFFPHFSVGQANILGSQPLMCLPRPAQFFSGIHIYIKFYIFRTIRCKTRGHSPPRPHYFVVEKVLEAPLIMTTLPHFLRDWPKRGGHCPFAVPTYFYAFLFLLSLF